MDNYAYVSLIATNNYIGAAITMMEAWKPLKSKYPFYLMVTDNITKENRTILEILGYKLLNIKEWRPQPYDFQKSQMTGEDISLWHGTDNVETRGWRHTFSKLLVWNLTQFEKVCWLDLDILFFRNIDDVFEFKTPAWLGPDINGHSASQIFVIEPNSVVFQKLIDFAEHFPINQQKLFTDEEVLHTFFKEEVNNNKTIPLAYVYNWNRCGDDCGFIQYSFDIRGVHMTGTEKPWLSSRKFVATYSTNWYAATFIWNYYISLYNLGVTKLKQKGFDLPLVK